MNFTVCMSIFKILEMLPVGLYGASSELFLFFDLDLNTGLSSSDSREG